MVHKLKTIWDTKYTYGKEYLKHLLNTYNLNNEITDDKIKGDLLEVFKNHKFKNIKDHSCSIYVSKHYIYNTKCFKVIDGNGQELYFSHKNIKLNNHINYAKELFKLLRLAIKDEIYKVKLSLIKRNGLYCEISGRKTSYKNLVVDHKPPYNFNVIVDAWIKTRKLKVTREIFEKNIYGDFVLSMETSRDFIAFHNNISRNFLRLIHKKINNYIGAEFKLLEHYENSSTKQLNLFNNLKVPGSYHEKQI